MGFLAIPILLAAIACISYGWFATIVQSRRGRLSGRRETAAWVCLACATLQVLFLVGGAILAGLEDQAGIRWTTIGGEVCFLAVLPCAIIWRGRVWIWLVLASVLLAVLTGFVYLISGWQF
jgi:hypothetical protein